jgi:hypothetical protein
MDEQLEFNRSAAGRGERGGVLAPPGATARMDSGLNTNMTAVNSQT